MVLPVLRASLECTHPEGKPLVTRRTSKPPKSNPIKVLILEDDHFVLSMWKDKLKRFGCDVTFCESPLQAKPLIDGGYRPDLIISDLEMPGVRGDEFCTFVKTACPGTPFVLISGSPSVFDLGHLCGADFTYMKPLSQADIQGLIKRYSP